jgi:hypothetical protein
MISPPNANDRTIKTVVGRMAIRIQIPESVLQKRDGAVSAVVSGGKAQLTRPPRGHPFDAYCRYPLALTSGADQDIDV